MNNLHMDDSTLYKYLAQHTPKEDLYILDYPHPGLTRTAQPVDSVTDAVRHDALSMFELYFRTEHCGALAATQLSFAHPYAITILGKIPQETEQVICLINGEIIARSGALHEVEGCMSVYPDAISATVKRSQKVTVRGFNFAGELCEHTVDGGYLSRCFQHELDHLKGKIYLDHLSPLKRHRIQKKIQPFIEKKMSKLPSRLVLPAPGKVNHNLHVLEPRDDGLHNLWTQLQYITWADTLTFTLQGPPGSFVLKTDDPALMNDDNLVCRAARALITAAPHAKNQAGLQIHLQKKIPVGAGLGGGSSNAATTLLALNLLWELDLSFETLQKIARSLGADVPFFVFGHSALAQGMGEQLTPITCSQPWLLIIFPHIHCSTAKVFRHKALTPRTQSITMATCTQRFAHNDLQAIACKLYPGIAQVIDWLMPYKTCVMSGSGSSVFACFDNLQQAQAVAKKVPPKWQAIVTRAVNKSPLHPALSKYWGVAKW